MSPNAKFQSRRACIVVAGIILLTNGMIMCACPGWPAMGAGLSIAAIYLGSGSRQIMPYLLLAGCVLATGVHIIALSREKQAHEKVLLRIQQQNAADKMKATTNSLPQLITQ